jgi:hypothetical protein
LPPKLRSSAELLAAKPRRHPCLDEAGRDDLDRLNGSNDLARVLGGLKQTGDDLGLPVHGRHRLRLEADEGGVVGGQGVGVGLPPAFVLGFAGEGDELVAVRLVDAVEVEQFADVRDLGPGFGRLDAADLGR